MLRELFTLCTCALVTVSLVGIRNPGVEPRPWAALVLASVFAILAVAWRKT